MRYHLDNLSEAIIEIPAENIPAKYIVIWTSWRIPAIVTANEAITLNHEIPMHLSLFFCRTLVERGLLTASIGARKYVVPNEMNAKMQ